MMEKNSGNVINRKKILHLTLKRKWFDMISSGEKKEEYREIKPYWTKRLFADDIEANPTDYHNALNDLAIGYDAEHVYNVYGIYSRKYDLIEFRNGYSKNAPRIRFKITEITTGEAKPEWSDNWKGNVFIIKLGKVDVAK